jgi:PhoPQ-activated pathogenicity-related protein
LDSLTLRIKPEGNPLKVRVWVASSPSLDFREAKWEAKEIKGKNGVYEFTLTRPKEGYSAMFGEVRYKIGDIEFAQSTTPKILK